MKGVVLDHWVLVGEPREGGTAMVWRAIDSNGDEEAVAVKIVHSPSIGQRTADLIWDREFRTLQRLEHPNIVSLLDVGVDRERQIRYFVLPWRETSLEDALREHPPEGWDDFYEAWGRPILRGLAHAHSRGVAHRDIKPGNVLLDEAGTPQIADFGIARVVEDVSIGHTVRDWKSPPYAPRNHTPPNLDKTVDVYAFGAVCALALEPQSGVSEPYDRLDAAMEALDVPIEIDRVLRRCLSEDASERHASAEAVLDEIEAISRARHAVALQYGHAPQLPLVPLRLVGKTERKLLGLLDLQTEVQLEDVVLSDLADGFAFLFDPPKTADQRVSFRLIGSELVLRLTLDEGRLDGFVVIDGYPSSSAELERQRERGYAPAVRFTFESARGRTDVAETLRRLAVEIEEHHHERRHALQEESKARPFKIWRRTLAALRAVERSREEPLHYRRFKPGAVTEFVLAGPPPEDVIGQARTASLVEQGTLTGEVVAVSERTVSLRVLEGDPRDLPIEGVLRVDTRAAVSALRRQERGLDAVEFGNALRSDLGKLMLEPTEAREPQPQAPATWFRDGLDEAKRDAVAQALGTNDLLLVEGPPGTGKTTFITELIQQELRRQPTSRILLASQTHAALDNVLERLQEADDQLRLLRVARGDDSKVAPSVAELRLDRQIRRWKREAERSGSSWLSGWAKARGLNVRDVEIAMRLEELSFELRRAQRLEDEISELDARIGDAESQQEAPTGATEADVVQALRGQRSEVRRELDQCRRDARSLSERLAELGELPKNERLEDLEVTTLEDRALELAEASGDEAEHCQKLISLLGEWNARFGVGPDFEAAALVRSQVIAATCVGLGSIRGLDSIEFDLCIVDEASKATATELFIPMSRATRWVLVGDSRQLPPFIDEALRSSEVLRDYGLRREELEDTLFSRLRREAPEACSTTLNHQHRMLPAIGQLVSDCFYRSELTSEPRDVPSWHGLVLPRPVTWFTTTQLDGRHERFSGTSYSNPCEARQIRRLLGRLNFAAKAARVDLSVAVLAAYTEQRHTIERTLAEELARLDRLTVEVNTVDAFQGREADVAVYSVTRSNPSSRIGFLRESSRINVALSRARSGLLIVGDHAFCRRVPGANPMRVVLEHIESNPDACALEVVEA